MIKRKPTQIIVKPKDPNSVEADRERARHFIMNAVNPEESKVTNLSNCANNGLRISMFGDKDELMTNLKENLNDDYEVVEKNKAKPKIKIVNFLNAHKWNLDEIEDAIRAQNENLFSNTDKLKIVNSFEHKNSNEKMTLIAEVNGVLFRKIMKEKKLSVGWCICFVYDAAHVTRCYKCSRFSHIETNCKSSKISCPKCSGEHKLKECKSKDFKCVNCVEANEKNHKKYDVSHPCWSKNCESLKSKMLKRKTNIDFE